jgi:hypothetical protein
MSDKTPRVIAVRDDPVFDDIKVTTYASSEALDAAIAAEIDGEAKLVPQDATVITERADVRFINEAEVLASCGQLPD